MLHRETLPDGRTRLTFVLPEHEPPGEVSVVGSFNQWRAGEHPLVVGDDGARRVSVTVDEGSHYFRYLATGDVWVDDPDADSITEHGSTVYCPAPAAEPAGSAASKPKTSRTRNGASKSTSNAKAAVSPGTATKKTSRAASTD